MEVGSQSFYEISCVLCDEDGRHIEAFTYCSDCRLYLCQSCLRLHQRFPPNSTHQLTETTQTSGNPRYDDDVDVGVVLDGCIFIYSV